MKIRTWMTLALAAVLLPAQAGSARAASCSDTLDAKSYDCRVTDSFGVLFDSPVCFEFSSGGTNLATDFFGSAFSCICRAEGTVRMPEFGSSPNFDCVGLFGGGDTPMDFQGRAAKQTGRIKDGRFNFGGIVTGVFKCVERDTPCSAAMALDAGVANRYREALR